MFLDMLLQTIIDIAAKCGWSVTVSVIDIDCTAFDFRRRTRSGVPFCFCADMTGGNPATLLDEILSFIDAFQPSTFARQWCELSGAGDSLEARALAEMDDMRTEAWLLAVELSEAIASPERHNPPWYLWN